MIDWRPGIGVHKEVGTCGFFSWCISAEGFGL